MSSTLTEKAVVGRRILHTRYSDLGKPGAAQPGIITELALNQGGQVKIRLDGQRWTMHVPANYEGITYLGDVVPVPELPMGRFLPVASDQNGFYEKAGVLVATVGEEGEDILLLTADPVAARAALHEYAEWAGLDLDHIGVGDLRPKWAVFEWEPEDAECPWGVRWGVTEDDDQAVHIYHLPT
jgi:hypothetical protein